MTGEAADAAVSFPYEVSSSELERFDVLLGANDDPASYTWRLAVAWRSGTREGTLVIDRGGLPFSTTVSPASDSLVWGDDGVLRDPYE